MTASKRQAPARSRKPSGGGDPRAASIRLRVQRGAIVRHNGRTHRGGASFTTTVADALALIGVAFPATQADDDKLDAAWRPTARQRRTTASPTLPDGLHVVPDEDEDPSLARQFLRP